MTRDPTNNPYWHELNKPLAFDCIAVQSMCLEAFEILLATRGIDTLWNSDLEEFDEKPAWSYPSIVKLHQDEAEKRLSTIFLSIAAAYRALDDQLHDNGEFKTFKIDQLNTFGGLLTVYKGTNIPDSLRECCNKIIHTEDFRPVYDNGSQPRDEGVWYMTGELELEGIKSSDQWRVCFDMFVFLEAILDTIKFLNGGFDASELAEK